jgi:LemA protein
MTIALVIGVAVLGWAVFTFNRLIRLRQLGDNAWSDIDVQLKRRHDLIPNVVAVVQGHAGYERGTLAALVAARGRALQASDRGPGTRAREEDPLSGALQRVVAVAESYPELRAAASFAGLQRTLTDVEDHLQNARRYYNAVVRDFNTAIAQFPASVVAGMMRLHPREFFGLDDPSERAVPRVPLALLLLFLGGGASGTVIAQQRSYSIERFTARIHVNRDASLDVTETITARFVGSWNGLYRTIPVDYHTLQGLNWRLGVSLQSARDDAGHDLRTETSRVRQYIKYKIWVPNAKDAVRTIVVRYRATNGLRFLDEHDELYWNVTGDEWMCRSVRLPRR